MKKCASIFCDNEAQEGRAKCPRCLKYACNAQARMRAKRKKQNLCMLCGKEPPSPGKTQCAPCRGRVGQLAKRRYARRKGAGLCVSCGKQLTEKGPVHCSACASVQRHAAKTRQRKTVRWQVLERDEFTCRLCGRTDSAALVVHHRNGQHSRIDLLTTADPNSGPENLITLCRKCHNGLTHFYRNCTDTTLLSHLLHEPTLD